MLNCNYYIVSDVDSYHSLTKFFKKSFDNLQFFLEKESLVKSIEFLSQNQSYLDNNIFIVFAETQHEYAVSKYLKENLDDLSYVLISFGYQRTNTLGSFTNIFDFIELTNHQTDSRFILYRLESEIMRKNRMTALKLQIREFYEIGKQLSSERDIFKLFDMIVSTSLNITLSDAVTLYLVADKDTGEWSSIENNDCSNKVMKFVISKNTSLNTDYQSFSIPITKKSITGYTAILGKSLRIDNTNHITPEMEYKHDNSFDKLTGYKTVSMLSVPMKDRNNNVSGVIQLINKKKDMSFVDYRDESWVNRIIPFNYFDEHTMNSIAGQAAVALENNLLYKNINQLLQEYVEQNEKLTVLSSKILKAHEEERKRIAREIHDGPAQSAACLALKLELCKRQLQNKSYDQLSLELDKLGDDVRLTVKEIRDIIYDLKPSHLDEGLFTALRNYIETYTDNTGLYVELKTSGKDIGLQYYLMSTVFRIVQEALTNISKHAEASRVTIKLNISKNMLQLDIKDNGHGFDTTVLEEVIYEKANGGFGIEGMKERVDLINGSIDINSAIGIGTVIKVQVPLNQQNIEITQSYT
ncbi:MAG: histidine kinase,GAF protein [Clostridia bacterium]|jgi:two-component system sensor histidine kinase DegS|nr:histidine kinase,GAF protein [Clostridia bacterium]